MSPGTVEGRALLATVVCALFLGWAAVARAAEPPASEQFLALSDIHFDPMADPHLVDRLAAVGPAEWPTVLDESGDKSLGRYGADTNWRLLHSALAQMQATLPHPAFVLITGDFLAHHFRERFNAAASDHSDAAFRGFVDKTMGFLALQLQGAFPGTAILPALGNNDEICGDFELQPGGPFLSDMLPVARGLVGERGKTDLGAAWTSYGNYVATLPKLRGIRVIFANTVFFARRYRNACGAAGGSNPAEATLAWLSTQLAAAERAHEHVWLAYHVPPGIDGFATWRLGSCPDRIVAMWDQTRAADFTALLRRYAATVVASFAGHTHMDDFRLVGDVNGNFGFVLITPGLSPIFGQNPAFRTVAFARSGALLDETTYGLTNLGEAGASAAPRWRAEYTFTREWRLPRLDLPNLVQLYGMIIALPPDRERWQTLFPVSSPVYWTMNPNVAAAMHAFDCATGHVSPDAYRQCWCGAAK